MSVPPSLEWLSRAPLSLLWSHNPPATRFSPGKDEQNCVNLPETSGAWRLVG